MRFANPKDAIEVLTDRLMKLDKPYAGARFRAAFLKEGLRFLTGSVVFWPEELPSRSTADYGVLVLADHWESHWGDALNLLSEILNGEGDIGGQHIKSGFGLSDLDHRSSMSYGMGTGGWSGWEMRSHYDPGHGPNNIESYIQDSILGFGLRPYRGGNQAINDWVFNLQTHDIGGSIPYTNCLVTFLPDTRARVLSALWTPGKLNLGLEINMPSEEIELQILYLGSTRLPYISKAIRGGIELQVPDDARELLIYLVHREGECIMTVHLHHIYDSFGQVPKELITKSKVESDLGKGEGDQIEFKPFISAGNPKESEIVETVIAFANTSGGRVYVGVEDRDASLLGSIELRKTFKGSEDDALKALANRLRLLISNRVVPTPRVLVEDIRIFEAPLVTITVEPGGNTHCDGQNNQVWVRRGASNMRPKPGDRIQFPEF
jgi:hypothetical protein